MSALKILATVARGTQLVQIPKDRLLALAIPDSLGMDTTVQVIQINQCKFFFPFQQVKPPQLPAPKAISFLNRPSSSYSIRRGVFIWFRFPWWTHAIGSPNFNFTCIIFFSWQWITMSLPSFLCTFLDENFQLSIPTVIAKFYIVFPPSTFCLNISEDDHGSTVYVDLISEINEYSENTHKCSKGKATCANTAGSFICSCRPGFTADGHNFRGKILKIISFIRKKIHFCCCLLPKGANALKKRQSKGPGCFFIGRFNYAEEGITRSKSNVIWQVCLGIRGPPGILNQEQWFFPSSCKTLLLCSFP